MAHLFTVVHFIIIITGNYWLKVSDFLGSLLTPLTVELLHFVLIKIFGFLHYEIASYPDTTTWLLSFDIPD